MDAIYFYDVGVRNMVIFKPNEKTPCAPAAWEKTHPGASYAVVNRTSWLDFVLASPQMDP
jgi:hypothetical protein